MSESAKDLAFEVVRHSEDASFVGVITTARNLHSKQMRNVQSQSDFADDWESWHRDHELRRARPLGFLAITGLHWLDGEPRRFDDVPGTWSSSAHGVHVVLGHGEELVVDGDRVAGDHHFDHVDESGDLASFGDAVVEVSRRDGHFMIRPRHPDNPVRTNYRGTPSYPANLDWVVTGRLISYDPPHSITVGATVEGLEHIYESPGELEFSREGLRLRLIAFNGEEPNLLFIIFTDQTSGTTTYAACRFLSVNGPGPDGTAIIDFNRATNPPCAYTDFATCPLPPPGNHLPLRVEAGERRPRE